MFEEEHNRDHERAVASCAVCEGQAQEAIDLAQQVESSGVAYAEPARSCGVPGCSSVPPEVGCGSCQVQPSPCSSRFAHLKDPMWNLKLVCEELTLLEQHLMDPEFRCSECIRKHLLYIQGSLREAIRLDEQGVLSAWLDPMCDAIHLCGVSWSQGMDPVRVGQLLRAIRARTTNHFGIV